MISPFVLWPCVAGVGALVVGAISTRRDVAGARGLDKLVAFGPVLFAAPLAVFGAEHLSGPHILMQVVPPWMPARLFWAYFVGFALVAGALSLVLQRYVRASAPLLASMFCLFVLMIHLPNVVANPHDRFAWAVMLRDFSFGAGALALAGTQAERWRVLTDVGRVCVAIVVIVFGVELLLHPEFAPGVPLPKRTPAWVPVPALWGYLTGAIFLAGGGAMLANKKARVGATAVGLALMVLTVFLYLPILTMAVTTPDLVEGVNYVFDTMLAAGTVLLVAGAMQARPMPLEVPVLTTRTTPD